MYVKYTPFCYIIQQWHSTKRQIYLWTASNKSHHSTLYIFHCSLGDIITLVLPRCCLAFTPLWGPLYTVFSISYLIVVIVFVKDFRKHSLGFIDIRYPEKYTKIVGVIFSSIVARIHLYSIIHSVIAYSHFRTKYKTWYNIRFNVVSKMVVKHLKF